MSPANGNFGCKQLLRYKQTNMNIPVNRKQTTKMFLPRNDTFKKLSFLEFHNFDQHTPLWNNSEYLQVSQFSTLFKISTSVILVFTQWYTTKKNSFAIFVALMCMYNGKTGTLSTSRRIGKTFEELFRTISIRIHTNWCQYNNGVWQKSCVNL